MFVRFFFQGQIVSTKREDLNHILDQFNIQVDNPVSILNQDTSRNFLHSKSPYDKYKVNYNMLASMLRVSQTKHRYCAKACAPAKDHLNYAQSKVLLHRQNKTCLARTAMYSFLVTVDCFCTELSLTRLMRAISHVAYIGIFTPCMHADSFNLTT